MQPYDYWQEFYPAGSFDPAGPHEASFPATLGDGCQLLLPIRMLAGGQQAIASLIINQASFSVLRLLATDIASKLRAYRPDVVVGLPTLGLTLAAAVAEALGHPRYVPLGTSRKFWYDEKLSVPLTSITTPHQQKRLYVDPRMLPLMTERRVVLIDDVMSSGASMAAGLSLLATVGVEPAAVGAAMLQTDRWRVAIAGAGTHWPERVVGAFSTPLLVLGPEGGWIAEPIRLSER